MPSALAKEWGKLLGEIKRHPSQRTLPSLRGASPSVIANPSPEVAMSKLWMLCAKTIQLSFSLSDHFRREVDQMIWRDHETRWGATTKKHCGVASFFDLEKAGLFVELRFCSSLVLLQSQTSNDAVGPAEPPPMAKVGHWARNCPQSEGLRKRFEHVRTTPLTQAMLGHKLRTRLQDPQGCVRAECRQWVSEKQLSLVVCSTWWWSEETI